MAENFSKEKLEKIAADKNERELKTFLASGGDVNLVINNLKNSSILLVACKHGSSEEDINFFRLLFDYGANLEIRDHLGYRVIDHLVYNTHISILNLFLFLATNIDFHNTYNRINENLLHIALKGQNRNIDILEALLKLNIDMEVLKILWVEHHCL